MTSLTMQELGKKMHEKGVREVIFVHGTAVGNDPLDIFNDPTFFGSLSQTAVDRINALFGKPMIDNLIDAIKEKTKESINNTLKDVGNYSPSYVKKFSEKLGNGICEDNKSSLPDWGSGNSHIARLEGAVTLAATIAQSIDKKSIQPDKRILLIGHSHAGQLFALLTIFLEGGSVANELLEFVKKHKIGRFEQINKHLETIKTVWLDFVTFGTPVRYKYAKYNKFRLLPVINHRSNSRLDLMAILNVEDGDYVQQWGTEGTNLPKLNPDAKALEDELSKILNNAGFDLSVALKKAARSARNQPVGRDEVQYLNNSAVAKNVLIDYEDARSADNHDSFYCVKKVFGHGIYTTEEQMLRNTQIIVDHLYKN